MVEAKTHSHKNMTIFFLVMHMFFSREKEKNVVIVVIIIIKKQSSIEWCVYGWWCGAIK